MKTYLLFTLLFIARSILFAQNSILVISGGGAKGAWGGGVAQSLREEGKTYSKIIGTSTGSLMGPFVGLGLFDSLKTAYTTVTQKSIFNVNPFKTSGTNKGGLRPLNAVWRGLFYHTLGESKNLKRRISKFFTEQNYKDLRKKNIEFLATVVNMTNYEVAYKSINDYDFENVDEKQVRKDYLQMVNWIWASANEPIFMSRYVTKDKNGVKNYWQDGGIRETIALQKAVQFAMDNRIQNIDVIVHSTVAPQDTVWVWTGVLSSLIRTIDILEQEVKESNIQLGVLLKKVADEEKLTNALNVNPSTNFSINIYYMLPEDYKKVPNSLVFEKDVMLNLWERGQNKNYFKQSFDISEQSLRKTISAIK